MLVEATGAQARAILGAMTAIAAMHGEARITAADRASLAAAYHFLLRQPEALDFDDAAALPRPSPSELAAVLPGRALATEAAHMLTIMAFVDGSLDRAKIRAVLDYTAALGIDEPYVQEITEAAQGHVACALADMTRQNLESITGRPWADEDAMAWFLPYRGDRADSALAARYRGLASLPAGTLGREYWEQYQRNGYAFPGEPNGLNETFATPHDCTHALSGYDTSPRGELLVSTFTAAMHSSRPMEGHILPVIFSWHLGIRSTMLPARRSARWTRANSGMPGRGARRSPRICSRRAGISGAVSRSASPRCGTATGYRPWPNDGTLGQRLLRSRNSRPALTIGSPS
jgi:hypothetical protein